MNTKHLSLVSLVMIDYSCIVVMVVMMVSIFLRNYARNQTDIDQPAYSAQTTGQQVNDSRGGTAYLNEQVLYSKSYPSRICELQRHPKRTTRCRQPTRSFDHS